MAYIVMVNPLILSSAGVPKEPAIAATALAAGVCCIIMGLTSNFPVALASGMGLNAIVVQIAGTTGSWQAAMGLVVLDGIVVLVLVLTGLREAVMNAIPRELRLAIGAGIGLFIAFIGLVNAGIVLRGPIPSVPVTYGTLQSRPALVALFGLLLTAVLMARRVRGALIIGIIASTLLALPLKVAQVPEGSWLPSFQTLFKADIRAALHWQFVPLLMALVLVDFFDTLGTVTGLAYQANLYDERGQIPRLRQILAVQLDQRIHRRLVRREFRHLLCRVGRRSRRRRSHRAAHRAGGRDVPAGDFPFAAGRGCPASGHRAGADPGGLSDDGPDLADRL